MPVPAVELRSVTIRIGTRSILTNASCVFGRPELSLVCGRVGCGKTLLAQVIAGIRKPDSGTIRRNRSRISMVFQHAEHGLLGETVLEDLILSARSAGMDGTDAPVSAARILSDLGISHLTERYVVTLSGGEARLVAIAGALLSHADVIIADEPFVNLDWPSVRSVLRALIRARQTGKTVIVITHEIEKVLAHAERLIVLHHARIALNRTYLEYEDVHTEDREILKQAGVRLHGFRREQTWL